MRITVTLDIDPVLLRQQRQFLDNLYHEAVNKKQIVLLSGIIDVTDAIADTLADDYGELGALIEEVDGSSAL